MKRLAILIVAATIFVPAALAAEARAQQARPRAPILTTDDLMSPAGSALPGPEKLSASHSRGSTLPNARSVLESVFTKMAEVKSVRTRIQSFLSTGQREVVIEAMKPDRMHVTSPEGEFIAIGSTFYLKNNGGWRVTTLPTGKAAQSASGLDFGALVKQMLGTSGLLIAGHQLGDQVLDGVDTAAYEFDITDRTGNGTIQVSVGKLDGYMRRLSISGGPRFSQGESELIINVWFTDINETFSIQPPM
jgi:hypothetical protein